MTSEATITGSLSIIKNKMIANDFYSSGWYGELTEEGYLILNPHETVILLERQRIQVKDESGNLLSLESVISHFSSLIPNFLVHHMLYKDLRGRGYIVKNYDENNNFFTLYSRGASPTKGEKMKFALIVPFIEGVMFNINQIDQIVATASKAKLKLIFAVIDSLGDVSYYIVDLLDFPQIKKEKETTNEL